jgi:hypothetical protein
MNVQYKGREAGEKLLKMLVAETENFGSLIQVYAASLRCDAIA